VTFRRVVRDGWQYRAEQFRDDVRAALPVIVMSGAGRVVEQAQMPGLQDDIEKSVPPARLLNMLGRYCAEP
jgi:hypothetical protein